MNSFLFLLFAFRPFFALISSELDSDLSSDTAFFDGGHLTLNGHVQLSHALGQMQAENIKLKKGENELPFSAAYLQNQVIVSFHHASELFCDLAYLDFTQKKGTAFSKKNPVHYRHEKQEGIDLFCKKMDFTFNENQKETLDLTTLHAQEEVTIFITPLFDPNRSIDFKDEIQGSELTLLIDQFQLHMCDPHGTISHKEEAPLTFASKKLLFNSFNDQMTLSEDVTLSDPLWGSLRSDETVHITRKKEHGKSVIQTLEAKGKTTVETPCQNILSYGMLKLDREQLLITGESVEETGITPLNKQLRIDKDRLTLFSNQAALEYHFHDGTLKPLMLSLTGSVRMVSDYLGLADEVLFCAQTETIRLISHSDQEVLFWNLEKNMELIAQEIVIFPDPETKKQVVKGIGNVRFTFSQKEKEKLMHFFPKELRQRK